MQDSDFYAALRSYGDFCKTLNRPNKEPLKDCSYESGGVVYLRNRFSTVAEYSIQNQRIKQVH